MAGAIVQSKTNKDESGASATTITATWTSNTTTGNLIHLHVGAAGSTAPSSVTDSQSNTYTLIEAKTNVTQNQSSWTYYAKNITGGTTPTVTVTWAAATPYRRLLIAELSGLDTTAPLDVHVSNSQDAPGTGTDAVTSTAVTTTNANDYLIGDCQDTGSLAPGPLLTAGTNYVKQVNDGDVMVLEDRNVTSTGSYAATFTGATGISYTVTLFTAYKLVGGGGGAATDLPPETKPISIKYSQFVSAGQNLRRRLEATYGVTGYLLPLAAEMEVPGTTASGDVSSIGATTPNLAGASLVSVPVSITGATTANLTGQSLASGVVSIAGATIANLSGQSLASGAVSAAGSTIVNIAGSSVSGGSGDVNAGGAAIVDLIGQSQASGAATGTGSSVVNVDGKSTATGQGSGSGGSTVNLKSTTTTTSRTIYNGKIRKTNNDEQDAKDLEFVVNNILPLVA